MAHKGILALLWVICVLHLASGQVLTLSECAANCTTEVTSQSSSCRFGVQCFCTDSNLYDLGKDCWKSNCTIRETLTAQNVTSISCNFPDRDRGPTSSAVTFTSMAIALCFFALRIVAVSSNIKLLWGWDDTVVVFSTILMIANAVCNPISRSYGYGRDTWRIPFGHTDIIEEIFYIGGVIYATGVASIKIAFLLFYIKLFTSRTFRWVAYPLLAVTFVQGMIFTFLFVFQCTPISYTWTQWDDTRQGKCLNFDVGAVLHAITNILLDLLIFALPIWQLWSLNLSKKKKFQVITMFCVGFFVTLVSVLRLSVLVTLGDTWNPSSDFVPLGYWSDLEFNIGIACICMPSLRVVIRRYFPNCGLTSSAHDQDESGSKRHPRPVDLTLSNTARGTGKSFKSSARRVTRDDASDQVELYNYSNSETPR